MPFTSKKDSAPTMKNGDRNRKARGETLTQAEYSFNRAQVMLQGAQNALERATKLLQRKSTGPHNFHKRMRRVQQAGERLQGFEKALKEFQDEYVKEQVEALHQAAKDSPVQEEISATADFLDSMVVPEVTEAPVG